MSGYIRRGAHPSKDAGWAPRIQGSVLVKPRIVCLRGLMASGWEASRRQHEYGDIEKTFLRISKLYVPP